MVRGLPRAADASSRRRHCRLCYLRSHHGSFGARDLMLQTQRGQSLAGWPSVGRAQRLPWRGEPRQALPWGLPGGWQALPAPWPWREQLPRRHPSCHARSPRHHVPSASRPRNTEVAGVLMNAQRGVRRPLTCLSVSRLCTWKSQFHAAFVNYHAALERFPTPGRCCAGEGCAEGLSLCLLAATVLEGKSDLKLPAALKMIQFIVSVASAEDVKSWPSWSHSRPTAGTQPWPHTWS